MAGDLNDGPAWAKDAVERVVARQPIIGVDDRIVGFRLLHRPTYEPRQPDPHPDETVTVSALLGEAPSDVDVLVGDTQLFCGPWPGLLTWTGRVVPPSHPIVLEVPAELVADDETVDRCRLLAQAGYSIAVRLPAWMTGIEPLLELADVVEIDLAGTPRDQVLELVARCRPFDVTLLANRCADEDDLAWAAGAGFTMFHGPAVQRPDTAGKTLAPSALGQVQLATELLDERLDFGRVEEILNHEPALVVQVLHHASLGAAGGLRREVHSVREALVVLGTMRLRQWAALAVLGRNVGNSRSDALTVALVRARMCALLARPTGIDRGYAFTAGLLSALDRLLGIPITEVERRVDVDKELGAAAFRRWGRVGELVGLVADYQVAVEAGEPVAADLRDVEMVAAMSFAWAMSLINAIERASALD